MAKTKIEDLRAKSAEKSRKKSPKKPPKGALTKEDLGTVCGGGISVSGECGCYKRR
jgi:hypothetical protein